MGAKRAPSHVGEGRLLDVLLIEDNPGDARLFGELLAEGELAAEHRWETTLEAGLDATRENPPDLLVVGLNLPDSRGLDTVRRAAEAAPEVPIVVMTGLAELDTATEALGVGASEYLRKDGLTPALLARTLRMAMERHRLEREAERQRRVSRSILESLPEHIALLAADGTIRAVNEAWTGFAASEGGDPRGYEGEDYLAVTEAAAARGSEDARAMLEGVRAVLEGERAYFSMEYPCHGPDERRWFRVEVTPLRGGLERGAVVSHINITERVERERFLTTLIDNLPGVLYRCRNERGWPMEYVSPGLEELTGYPSDVLVAEGPPTFADLIHPDDRGRVWEAVQEALEEDRPFRMEYRIRTRDGREKWVWEQGRAVPSAPGDARKLEGYLVDVTEETVARRRAEEAEEKWRTAIELAPVGIVVSDPESGRLYAVNEAFEEMFGAPAGELVGSTSLELDQWEDPDRRAEIVAEVREHGFVEGEEAGFRTADGERGRMRVSCRRLELAGEDRLLWTVEDVSEARARQERLYLLESAVDATDHGLVITDRDGTIVWANPAFEEMTGYPLDEARGQNPRILQSGEQDEEFYEGLWDTILAGESWDGELVNRRKDGTRYVERMSIVPVRHGSDRVTHFIALKEDVTEEKEREVALRESEARHRALVETMAEAVVIVDPGGRIVFANQNAAELFGMEAGELTARTFDDPDWKIMTVEGVPFPEEEYPFRRVAGEQRTVRGVEHAVERPDGTRLIISVNAAPLWDDDEFDGMVATIRDVTEQKRLEAQLEHRALHDPLTGLANRTLFEDRLRQSLARSRRLDQPMGLLMVDVDGFKRINDHLGHTVGDRVLAELARRLESAVRDTDTVARWGGDEFIVVLPELERADAIEGVQARLREAVEDPIPVDGEQIEITLTIGGVVRGAGEVPGTVQSEVPEDLVRFADLALHRSKNYLPGGFYLFDPEDEFTEVPDLRLEQDLRRGIDAGEIEVFYQPLVLLGEGTIWGVEALARWRHPERGLILPGAFIPLAERVGLIHRIGDAVFRQGCEQIAAWDGEGTIPANLRIAFNLSARQLQRPGIVDSMEEWLEGTALVPERVVVEVTETAIMKAMSPTREIRELGVNLFIDDFGTGYSTFTYLRDLDAQGLKIDMTFVQELPDSVSDAAIVESMVTLAEQLGLEVVAEGIETGAQLAKLRELGCRIGQGFHLGRPVPADAFGREISARDPPRAQS